MKQLLLVVFVISALTFSFNEPLRSKTNAFFRRNTTFSKARVKNNINKNSATKYSVRKSKPKSNTDRLRSTNNFKSLSSGYSTSFRNSRKSAFSRYRIQNNRSFQLAKRNGAGYILSRNRIKNVRLARDNKNALSRNIRQNNRSSQIAKRNSAGYLLSKNRTKNVRLARNSKNALSRYIRQNNRSSQIAKRNSAGYLLSRDRTKNVRLARNNKNSLSRYIRQNNRSSQIAKRNGAGYILSRYRTSLSRSMFSFGSGTRY